MLRKSIACCLIMIATQGLGIAYSYNITCTIYHLTQLKHMLLYMIGEIQYLHKPFDEMCYGMIKQVKKPYDIFLNHLVHEMEQGKTMQEVWNKSACELEKSKSYPNLAMNYFEQIPKLFVYDGNDTQLASLQLYLKQIEEEITQLKTKKSTQGRVNYLLCTMLGLFLIVLFF